VAGNSYFVDVFAQDLAGYEAFAVDRVQWDPFFLKLVEVTAGPHLTFFDGGFPSGLGPPEEGQDGTLGFFDITAAPSDAFVLATFKFEATANGNAAVILQSSGFLPAGTPPVYFQAAAVPEPGTHVTLLIAIGVLVAARMAVRPV
jgi:hypothetical protein